MSVLWSLLRHRRSPPNQQGLFPASLRRCHAAPCPHPRVPCRIAGCRTPQPGDSRSLPASLSHPAEHRGRGPRARGALRPRAKAAATVPAKSLIGIPPGCWVPSSLARSLPSRRSSQRWDCARCNLHFWSLQEVSRSRYTGKLRVWRRIYFVGVSLPPFQSGRLDFD